MKKANMLVCFERDGSGISVKKMFMPFIEAGMILSLVFLVKIILAFPRHIVQCLMWQKTTGLECRLMTRLIHVGMIFCGLIATPDALTSIPCVKYQGV